MLLENVVAYLRSNGVSFRLESYPSPEQAPEIAHPTRAHAAVELETHLLTIDGYPGIVCVRAGEKVNLLRLASEVGAKIVEEGNSADLPWPFEKAPDPLPPLGRVLGATVFVDRNVANAARIEFAVFSTFDLIEMSYDELARIEQPRVGDFVSAGELPASVH
jgi:hypothetical protein